MVISRNNPMSISVDNKSGVRVAIPMSKACYGYVLGV